jgi:hypothetical protein
MVDELGTVSDLQAATALYQNESVTLGLDATTQDGLHFNEVHFTTKDKKVYIISFERLPGGTADDYVSQAVKAIEHLSKVYAEFHNEKHEEVFAVMKGNISNLMSDRASVNHAVYTKLQESLGLKLNEVKCNLHPLEAISNTCKTTLKIVEKNGGVQSKLFGTECTAVKIILAFNKLRFKDGKGDPTGFRSFLQKSGLPLGLVKRYRGNRLHILFHLAGIYTKHHDLFLAYLKESCGCKTGLRDGLLHDIQLPTAVLHLKILGLFGKILTGPWMKLFYTGLCN